jgi:ATP-binding cassette subfamily B protein
MSDLRVWVEDYSRVLLRSLPLLWAAAPQEMVVLIAVTLLQGFLPGVSVWSTKIVVDTVETA